MKEIKQMDEAADIFHLPISWEEKGKKEVALEMIKEGASIDFIVKVTRIDREEITELIKSIGK